MPSYLVGVRLRSGSVQSRHGRLRDRRNCHRECPSHHFMIAIRALKRCTRKYRVACDSGDQRPTGCSSGARGHRHTGRQLGPLSGRKRQTAVAAGSRLPSQLPDDRLILSSRQLLTASHCRLLSLCSPTQPSPTHRVVAIDQLVRSLYFVLSSAALSPSRLSPVVTCLVYLSPCLVFCWW